VSDTEVPGNPNTDESLNENDGPRLSAVDFVGDRDFYRAELSAGERYTITLNGTGDTPLTDPRLSVIAIDGAEVASDDDSGPGLNSRMVFRPTASGTYFVAASGVRRATGQYVINLERAGN
jgi:hypothetical protein